MIERFLTESEIKQTEHMIINHNICKTINNINDDLKRGLICYDKHYSRTLILKKDNKYPEIKKEYNKDQNNKYNYKFWKNLFFIIYTYYKKPKMVYISEEEMKYNEFTILRNSIYRGPPKDINKLLGE